MSERYRQRQRWRQRTDDCRVPERRDDEVPGLVHTYVCPACHAILKDTVWFVDEALYCQLEEQAGVWPALCPGCLRVARGIHQGEVLLQSRLLVPSKSAALHLIGIEEERTRCSDPGSRLTAVEDNGDQIKVLTTTPLLAERIGQAFRKAYEGDLEIERQRQGGSCRVLWRRD
jgi:hypothetical protein